MTEEALRDVAAAAEFYVVHMFTATNGNAIKQLKAALKAAGLNHQPL